MALYNVNLMIRESRKAQGLTQEKLAEGICSRETIVKLEKGTRKPNWFVFKEILVRLGLDPEIYQGDIASESDVSLLRYAQEIIGLIGSRKFDEAKAKIDEIEAKKNTSSMWKSGLGHGLLLRMKASFYASGALLDFPLIYKYLNPPLAVEYALEYIRITRPDFEIEKIPEYFLSMTEYQVLIILAKSYAMMTDSDKTISLWLNIKTNMEKNYLHSVVPLTFRNVTNQLYVDLQHNISLTLGELGRWEECLEIAEEGMTFAMQAQNMFSYERFLNRKSTALLKLNRLEESRECMKKVLLIHFILDGNWGVNFADSKKYYEAGTGEKLDLSVSW